MAKSAPTVPRIDGAVFLVLAYDGPGSAALRDEHLEGHLDYVEQHYERYLLCGPLRNPGEEELIGSFFLVRADSAEDAEAFVGGDPYVGSGMYAEVRIQEATVAAGSYLGGVIWESADAIRAATA